MSDFNIGDKVECIDANGATRSNIGDQGTVTRIHRDYGGARDLLHVHTADGRDYDAYDIRFKKLEKTMENLQVGDVLNYYGKKRKVLFANDYVLIVSDGCEDTDTVTLEREFIDPDDYSVFKKEAEEPKEMTVAEVSEALGHEVKIVKE